MSPSTVSRACRRFQETGRSSRRAGQGHRRSITHQQDRYPIHSASRNCQNPTKGPPAGHWCECLGLNNPKSRPSARHCGARLAGLRLHLRLSRSSVLPSSRSRKEIPQDFIFRLITSRGGHTDY